MGIQIPPEIAWAVSWAAGGDWPKPDEDHVRAIGAVWKGVSHELDRVAAAVDPVTARVLGSVKGAAASAFGSFASRLRQTIPSMAGAADDIGTMSVNTAQQVEYAKYMILAQSAWLAAEIVALASSFYGSALIPAEITAVRVNVQLILRRAFKAVVSAAVTQAAMDAAVQGIQFLKGDRTEWDVQGTALGAAMGAMGGAIGMPISLAGSALAPKLSHTVVGHAVTGAVSGVAVGAATNLAFDAGQDLGLAAGAGAIGGATGWRHRPGGTSPTGVENVEGAPEVPKLSQDVTGEVAASWHTTDGASTGHPSDEPAPAEAAPQTDAASTTGTAPAGGTESPQGERQLAETPSTVSQPTRAEPGADAPVPGNAQAPDATGTHASETERAQTTQDARAATSTASPATAPLPLDGTPGTTGRTTPTASADTRARSATTTGEGHGNSGSQQRDETTTAAPTAGATRPETRAATSPEPASQSTTGGIETERGAATTAPATATRAPGPATDQPEQHAAATAPATSTTSTPPVTVETSRVEPASSSTVASQVPPSVPHSAPEHTTGLPGMEPAAKTAEQPASPHLTDTVVASGTHPVEHGPATAPESPSVTHADPAVVAPPAHQLGKAPGEPPHPGLPGLEAKGMSTQAVQPERVPTQAVRAVAEPSVGETPVRLSSAGTDAARPLPTVAAHDPAAHSPLRTAGGPPRTGESATASHGATANAAAEPRTSTSTPTSAASPPQSTHLQSAAEPARHAAPAHPSADANGQSVHGEPPQGPHHDDRRDPPDGGGDPFPPHPRSEDATVPHPSSSRVPEYVPAPDHAQASPEQQRHWEQAQRELHGAYDGHLTEAAKVAGERAEVRERLDAAFTQWSSRLPEHSPEEFAVAVRRRAEEVVTAELAAEPESRERILGDLHGRLELAAVREAAVRVGMARFERTVDVASRQLTAPGDEFAPQPALSRELVGRAREHLSGVFRDRVEKAVAETYRTPEDVGEALPERTVRGERALDGLTAALPRDLDLRVGFETAWDSADRAVEHTAGTWRNGLDAAGERLLEQTGAAADAGVSEDSLRLLRTTLREQVESDFTAVFSSVDSADDFHGSPQGAVADFNGRFEQRLEELPRRFAVQAAREAAIRTVLDTVHETAGAWHEQGLSRLDKAAAETFGLSGPVPEHLADRVAAEVARGVDGRLLRTRDAETETWSKTFGELTASDRIHDLLTLHSAREHGFRAAEGQAHERVAAWREGHILSDDAAERVREGHAERVREAFDEVFPTPDALHGDGVADRLQRWRETRQALDDDLAVHLAFESEVMPALEGAARGFDALAADREPIPFAELSDLKERYGEEWFTEYREHWGPDRLDADKWLAHEAAHENTFRVADGDDPADHGSAQSLTRLDGGPALIGGHPEHTGEAVSSSVVVPREHRPAEEPSGREPDGTDVRPHAVPDPDGGSPSHEADRWPVSHAPEGDARSEVFPELPAKYAKSELEELDQNSRWRILAGEDPLFIAQFQDGSVIGEYSENGPLIGRVGDVEGNLHGGDGGIPTPAWNWYDHNGTFLGSSDGRTEILPAVGEASQIPPASLPYVAGRAVDPGAIHPTPVWSKPSDADIYRNSEYAPGKVFAEGFPPKGVSIPHLVDYVFNGPQDTVFVSATTMNDYVEQTMKQTGRATKYRHIYAIDPLGGIDINATLDIASPFPDQQEIVFPGGVQSRFIKYAQELSTVDGTPVGDRIPNPHYRPLTEEERAAHRPQPGPPERPDTLDPVTPGGRVANFAAPDTWTHRSDNAPSALLHSERFDPAGNPLDPSRFPGTLSGAQTLIRAQVRRIQADNGTWVRDHTVALPVRLDRTVTPHDLTTLNTRLQEALDAHVNTGYALPRSGDQLHVTLHLVHDDHHPEHLVLSRTPGPAPTDQRHWYLPQDSNDPAPLSKFTHEVLHYLGLPDEYLKENFLFRSDKERPAVHSDDALMVQADRFTPLPERYLTVIENTVDTNTVLRDHPLTPRSENDPVQASHNPATDSPTGRWSMARSPESEESSSGQSQHSVEQLPTDAEAVGEGPHAQDEVHTAGPAVARRLAGPLRERIGESAVPDEVLAEVEAYDRLKDSQLTEQRRRLENIDSRLPDTAEDFRETVRGELEHVRGALDFLRWSSGTPEGPYELMTRQGLLWSQESFAMNTAAVGKTGKGYFDELSAMHLQSLRAETGAISGDDAEWYNAMRQPLEQELNGFMLRHYTRSDRVPALLADGLLKSKSKIEADSGGAHNTDPFDDHVMANTGFVFFFIEAPDNQFRATRFGDARITVDLAKSGLLSSGWVMLSDFSAREFPTLMAKHTGDPDVASFTGSKRKFLLDRSDSTRKPSWEQLRIFKRGAGMGAASLPDVSSLQLTKERRQQLSHIRMQLVDEAHGRQVYSNGRQRVERPEPLHHNVLVGPDIVPGLVERTLAEVARISEVDPQIGRALRQKNARQLARFLLKDVVRPQVMVPNSVPVARENIEHKPEEHTTREPQPGPPEQSATPPAGDAVSSGGTVPREHRPAEEPSVQERGGTDVRPPAAPDSDGGSTPHDVDRWPTSPAPEGAARSEPTSGESFRAIGEISFGQGSKRPGEDQLAKIKDFSDSVAAEAVRRVTHDEKPLRVYVEGGGNGSKFQSIRGTSGKADAGLERARAVWDELRSRLNEEISRLWSGDPDILTGTSLLQAPRSRGQGESAAPFPETPVESLTDAEARAARRTVRIWAADDGPARVLRLLAHDGTQLDADRREALVDYVDESARRGQDARVRLLLRRLELRNLRVLRDELDRRYAERVAAIATPADALTPVPKDIHFFWIGKEPSAGALNNLEAWARSAGGRWQQHLWTDAGYSEWSGEVRTRLDRIVTVRPDSLAALSMVDRPKVLEVYETAVAKRAYNLASDIARYVILERSGGVYADVDLHPGTVDLSSMAELTMRPEDLPLLAPRVRDMVSVADALAKAGEAAPTNRNEQVDLAARLRWDAGVLGNHLIVAPPGSEFITSLLDRIPENFAALREHMAVSFGGASPFLEELKNLAPQISGPGMIDDRIPGGKGFPPLQRFAMKAGAQGVAEFDGSSYPTFQRNEAIALFSPRVLEAFQGIRWVTAESERQLDQPAVQQSAAGPSVAMAPLHVPEGPSDALPRAASPYHDGWPSAMDAPRMHGPASSTLPHRGWNHAPRFVVQSAFDVRSFRFGDTPVTDLTVRIAFRNASTHDADAIWQLVKPGVDEFFNRPDYHLPDSSRLHVTVDRVTADQDAHLTVDVVGHDRLMDQRNWWPDAKPIAYAHELAHQLGLRDEYQEGGASGRAQIIGSLMGDFWGAAPDGLPQGGLRGRHLQLLGALVGDNHDQRVEHQSASGPATETPPSTPGGPSSNGSAPAGAGHLQGGGSALLSEDPRWHTVRSTVSPTLREHTWVDPVTDPVQRPASSPGRVVHGPKLPPPDSPVRAADDSEIIDSWRAESALPRARRSEALRRIDTAVDEWANGGRRLRGDHETNQRQLGAVVDAVEAWRSGKTGPSGRTEAVDRLTAHVQSELRDLHHRIAERAHQAQLRDQYARIHPEVSDFAGRRLPGRVDPVNNTAHNIFTGDRTAHGALSDDALDAADDYSRLQLAAKQDRAAAGGVTVDAGVSDARVRELMDGARNDLTGSMVYPELNSYLDRAHQGEALDTGSHLGHLTPVVEDVHGTRVTVHGDPTDSLRDARVDNFRKAVTTVQEAGFHVPDVELHLPKYGRLLEVHHDLIAERSGGRLQRAEYLAPNAVIASPDVVGNPLTGKLADGRYRYLSTELDPSGVGTMVHELGHFLHYANARAQYHDLAFTQFAGRSGQDGDAVAHENLAFGVSAYAAGNPREFVAEVFTGLVYGKPFSPEVMRMYHGLGGPTLTSNRAPYVAPHATPGGPAVAPRGPQPPPVDGLRLDTHPASAPDTAPGPVAPPSSERRPPWYVDHGAHGGIEVAGAARWERERVDTEAAAVAGALTGLPGSPAHQQELRAGIERELRELFAADSGERWSERLREGRMAEVAGQTVWLRPALREVTPAEGPPHPDGAVQHQVYYGSAKVSSGAERETRSALNAALTTVLTVGATGLSAVAGPVPQASVGGSTKRSHTDGFEVISGRTPKTTGSTDFAAQLHVEVSVDGEVAPHDVVTPRGLTVRFPEVFSSAQEPRPDAVAHPMRPVSPDAPHLTRAPLTLQAMDTGPVVAGLVRELRRAGIPADTVAVMMPKFIKELAGEDIVRTRSRFWMTTGDSSGLFDESTSVMRRFTGRFTASTLWERAQYVGTTAVKIQEDLGLVAHDKHGRAATGEGRIGGGVDVLGMGATDNGHLGNLSVGASAESSRTVSLGVNSSREAHTVLTRHEDHARYHVQARVEVVTHSETHRDVRPVHATVATEILVPLRAAAEFERRMFGEVVTEALRPGEAGSHPAGVDAIAPAQLAAGRGQGFGKLIGLPGSERVYGELRRQLDSMMAELRRPPSLADRSRLEALLTTYYGRPALEGDLGVVLAGLDQRLSIGGESFDVSARLHLRDRLEGTETYAMTMDGKAVSRAGMQAQRSHGIGLSASANGSAQLKVSDRFKVRMGKFQVGGSWNRATGNTLSVETKNHRRTQTTGLVHELAYDAVWEVGVHHPKADAHWWIEDRGNMAAVFAVPDEHTPAHDTSTRDTTALDTPARAADLSHSADPDPVPTGAGYGAVRTLTDWPAAAHIPFEHHSGAVYPVFLHTDELLPAAVEQYRRVNGILPGALRERWQFPLELRHSMNSSALHTEFDALASPDGWHVPLDPHKNWKQALRLRLRAYDPVHHGRPDVSIERALQGRDRTTDSSRSGHGWQLTGQLGVHVRHDTNEVLAGVTASGSTSRQLQHEAQHGAGGQTRATYTGPVHAYRSDVVLEVTAIRWKGGTTESETTYLHLTRGMDSLVPHRLVSDLGLPVPEHVQARMDGDDQTPVPRRGPHRLLDDGVTEVPLLRYRERALGVLTGHVEQLHGAGVLTHIQQVLRERGLLPHDAEPRPNLRMQALRHRFSEEALAGNLPALLGNGVHAWMPITGAFGQTHFVAIRVTAKAFEAVEHWTRPETTLMSGGERSTVLSDKQVVASDRKITGEAEARGSVGSVKFGGGGEAGWLSKSSDTRWTSKNTKDVFRLKTREGSHEFTHPLRYRVEIDVAAQGPHAVHWMGTRVRDGVLTLGSLSARFLGTGNDVAAFWYGHQVGSWRSDSAAEGKVIDGSLRTLVPDHLTSGQPRAPIDPEAALIDRGHTLGKRVHWHTGDRPAPGPVETELAAHLVPKAFPAGEAVARWAALTTLPPRQRPADLGLSGAWQVPGLGLDSKYGMRLRLSATDGALRAHSGELLGHTYHLPLRDVGSVTVGLRVVRAQQVAEAPFKDRSYAEVEELPLAFRNRARGWDVAGRSYASGPGADRAELRGTGGLSHGRVRGASEEDETRLDYENNAVTSRALRYYGFDVQAFLIGPYGTLAMEVPGGLYGMLPTEVAEGLHAAHPDLFHGPVPTAEAKGKAPEAAALDDLMAGWEPPAAGSSTAPVRHLADRLRDAGLAEGSAPLRLRAGGPAHVADLARQAAQSLGRPIDLVLDSGLEQRLVPDGTDRSGAATPTGSVGLPSGPAQDTDPARSEAAPAAVVTEVPAPGTEPPSPGELPA
ncbi:scabin-related ADP-ribosyltransferase [Streptomyces lydicus]|uniref:scabin-related ADP-ribosyltransferase n=1 Tax=Streptomyces lydicus TaxID=47763 RepID=UPI000982467F|nr:glycosyltransferase [Streptomyces lydicus]